MTAGTSTPCSSKTPRWNGGSLWRRTTRSADSTCGRRCRSSHSERERGAVADDIASGWGSEVRADHQDRLIGPFDKEPGASTDGGCRVVVGERPVGMRDLAGMV